MTEVEKAARKAVDDMVAQFPDLKPYDDMLEGFYLAGAAWQRERDADYIERRTREDLKIADPTGSMGVMAEDYFSWRLAREIRAYAEKAGEER